MGRLLEHALARSQADVDALGEVPLGGTAVGTGINAPAGFAPAVIAALADETGLPLRPSANPMVHQGGQGALADASAGLRGIAVALTKIANDIRLLASGPVGRPRRAAPARAAGRFVDHAGQGQPGAVRVGQPGRRPGLRQRRHGLRSGRRRASSSSTRTCP